MSTSTGGEPGHDEAWTEEKACTLWARLEQQLAGRVTCEGCLGLAREYVAGTDIYGTQSWEAATRVVGTTIEMNGILHDLGPRFLAVFKKSAFGYYADVDGSCPSCQRRWHYRADLHLGSFEGCLTLSLQTSANAHQTH